MSDAIKDATKIYLDAVEALSEQRRQIEEDLEFSDPSNPQQWDKAVKAKRESDPGGARPCYVFDQCGQYISNVAGQVEQRPPSLHALPVGSGADKKVAEKIDGFYRHIEHASRAQQHYSRALTSAARAGVGYLIARPTYVNRALNWQEPRISSEGDPLKVVLDPWSTALDGQDASFGFLLTPFSHRSFERTFGAKAEKVSFGKEEESDHRESIIVAEGWRIDTKNQKMVVVTIDGPEGPDEVALTEDEVKQKLEKGEPFTPGRDYTEKRKVVRWARMSGVEELDKETEYPASYIGIVPVYGYVGWSGGRMTYCGIPRRAMSAQRSYNYHKSELEAFIATAPKSPWIASIRAVKGFETLWDRANVDTRAFLPYNDADEMGPITPPSRMPASVDLRNHLEGAEQALRDIQASLGMYQASIGAESNEKSGVAIDARKEQGEAATAHFPANLAAGIAQIGRLCVEMLPKLMDTRRQLRILGIDGTMGQVTVDPGQKEALQETPQGIVINPNVGEYDVRVAVGASFATQRTQAQAAFTEMMRANPEMTPAIAPLWAQTLDVPHADKLAQVLTAVSPPEVKAILSPENDKEPTTADLIARVQKLEAEKAELIQIVQESEQDIDEAQNEAQSAKQAVENKEDDLAIKAYDSLTKRLQVLGATVTPEQVQAIVLQTVNEALSQPQPQEPAQEQRPMVQPAPQPMQQPMQQAPMQPMQQSMPMPQQAPAQQMPAQVQPAEAPPVINELIEAQEHTAELLEMLIKLVQRDRVRVPVRDEKTGDITHVVDRLAPETPTEGPMQ